MDFLFKQQTMRRAAQKTIAWSADSHSESLYGKDGISSMPPPTPGLEVKRFSTAGAFSEDLPRCFS